MAHFLTTAAGPHTAIVCDDDAMTRRVVREILERCGYVVLAGVDNAIDALQLVLDHLPDVLVLDLVLPGISGEEIISAIHDSTHTQVIVHSSFDPRFAVKNGARLFASKGNLAMLEKQLMRVRGIEVSA